MVAAGRRLNLVDSGTHFRSIVSFHTNSLLSKIGLFRTTVEAICGNIGGGQDVVKLWKLLKDGYCAYYGSASAKSG